jgi:FKBP-type peptidyl-prolyl cis-trans isomerase
MTRVVRPLVVAAALALAVGPAACARKRGAAAGEAGKGSGAAPTGLEVEEVKAGTGAVATKGRTVSVHYTGRFPDGKKFDSSYDRGPPIEFVLGIGKVIKGWDQGIEGMRVGGRRRLTIPPELAYGARGTAPDALIPPNATLVFDVELVAVK